VTSAPVPSIAEYGLIGDTRTAALVSSDGSLDWLCFPRFDSPPLFGRLVGGEGAGRFAIEVDGLVDRRRRYLPSSAVLETTLTTAEGEAVLLEGMVADTSGSLLPQSLVVRSLSCRAGEIRGRVLFDPRLDWSAAPERWRRGNGRLVCTWGPIVATLASSPELPDPTRRARGVLPEVRAIADRGARARSPGAGRPGRSRTGPRRAPPHRRLVARLGRQASFDRRWDG